jgi:hypothetical protein
MRTTSPRHARYEQITRTTCARKMANREIPLVELATPPTHFVFAYHRDTWFRTSCDGSGRPSGEPVCCAYEPGTEDSYSRESLRRRPWSSLDLKIAVAWCHSKKRIHFNKQPPPHNTIANVMPNDTHDLS